MMARCSSVSLGIKSIVFEILVRPYILLCADSSEDMSHIYLKSIPGVGTITSQFAAAAIRFSVVYVSLHSTDAMSDIF